MKEKRIHYLGQAEKQLTRVMYEVVFPEDSKEFVDYYYKWKTEDNKILVLEEECLEKDNFFSVMMHFNPYTLWINGNLQKIPYIVAVATHPDCRKQGKMEQVMTYALQDMQANQIPFTFLLPANPAYYKGQGFVFFPNQAQHPDSVTAQIKAAAAQESYVIEKKLPKGLVWQKAKAQDIPQITAFSNEVLAKRYHIFVKRDMYYYQRLFAETAAENGCVLLLKFQEQLLGVLVYGSSFEISINDNTKTKSQKISDSSNSFETSINDNTKMKSQTPAAGDFPKKHQAAARENRFINSEKKLTAEIKELLLKSDVLQEEAKILCQKALPEYKINFDSSQSMVRITNLLAFVPLLKSEHTHFYYVKVKDSIIKKQQGCYQIEIGPNRSRIERISEDNIKQQLDISELTQILLQDTSVYLQEWV